MINWTPDKPLKELPPSIQEHFIGQAQEMLLDMELNKLEVGLIPAPEACHSMHMIRVAMSENIDWYQDYYKECNAHYHKSGCGATRRRVMKALQKIIDKKDGTFNGCAYRHHKDMREMIQDRLVGGYYITGHLIDAVKEVKQYFGKE